jgi:hypothetical protein
MPDLVKATIRFDAGQIDRIRRYHPGMPYNKAVRVIIEWYLKMREAKERQEFDTTLTFPEDGAAKLPENQHG